MNWDSIWETFKKGAGGAWDWATDEENEGIISLIGAGAAQAFGLNDANIPKVGYQGGIPNYTFQRQQVQQPADPNRRPGSGGRRYFTDAQFVKNGKLGDNAMASGGLASLHKPKRYAEGRYIDGATDGMADEVIAEIDGQEPARLSDGEFVIPADVVSHLGNGNSEAGAKVLEQMMARIRKERTGEEQQSPPINPERLMPR